MTPETAWQVAKWVWWAHSRAIVLGLHMLGTTARISLEVAADDFERRARVHPRFRDEAIAHLRDEGALMAWPFGWAPRALHWLEANEPELP